MNHNTKDPFDAWLPWFIDPVRAQTSTSQVNAAWRGRGGSLIGDCTQVMPDQSADRSACTW